MNSETNWSQVLDGVNYIVHLAGMAHFSAHSSTSELPSLLNKINIDGTRSLLNYALRAGIKRFIFISSIGALTKSSFEPLVPTMAALPTTLYGRSKLVVENMLKEAVKGSEMKYTIIRPPLVYGPGNPGNMAKILKIAESGIPLPLSALDSNRRSFVGVSNLIDLILLCMNHPAAVNQTFHVSDDDDISTGELLRRMGKALGKPVRNLPMPQTILKTGLRVLRKGEWVDKLFGDLRVDISETKRLLGWKPKVTMEEELERTMRWWRESQQGRI